jgi:hypothetical protein
MQPRMRLPPKEEHGILAATEWVVGHMRLIDCASQNGQPPYSNIKQTHSVYCLEELNIQNMVDKMHLFYV